MNACAIRIIQSFAVFQMMPWNNQGIIWDPLLPHEPKSDDRFRLDLVYQVGAIGIYAVCKHCDCIFRIEE